MKKIILLAMLFATITFGQSLPFLLFDDDREAPSAPTSPSAVGTAEAVAVSWIDPTALDLASIEVYAGTSTAPTTWIASVPKGTQTYNWTGRTAQTLYYLRVKAKDLSGNLSDYTSTVSDTALNTLYAFDFDGSTEYLSKASPISLDLNGTERVTDTLNAGFGVGTEVITNGSFGSNITGWSATNSTAKWYNTDWNAIGRTNCLLDSATNTSGVEAEQPSTSFVNGTRYKLTYTYYIPSTNTTTVKIRPRLNGGSSPYLTIQSVQNVWTTITEYFTADANYTYLFFYHINSSGTNTGITVGDKIYIDDVSIKPVPYWASNGTHSIATSSTQKYAGSNSGKVIATLGSELNSIPDWVNISYDSYSETNDSLVIDGVTNDYCRNDIITFSAGETYIISYLTQAITGTHVFRNNTDGTLIHTILSGANSFTHTFATAGKIRITCSSTGALTIENISFKKSSGDTTTNFISLASSNFTTLEAGKKYTVEYWANADSTGNGFTTKPTITMKIGSKSWTSDTISYYPGQFEKVVYNFQATSAEVNTPIKFFSSQSDTIYIDNYSISESKDALYSYWIKTADATAYLMDRYSSSTGSRTEILTSKIKHTIGGTYTATATSTDNITTNAWTLVSVIVNRTGNMQIYFNGVANGSAVSCTSVGKINNTNALNLFGTTYFAGLGGEVQIATFSDISTLNYTPAQLYYRGKAGYYFPTAFTGGTVVGHWTWEGADIDASLTDKSGTGNTLTPTAIDLTDRTTITY